MKRACGLLILAVVTGMSSGCSIIDRLFLTSFDGAPHRSARNVGGPCQNGACGACENGQCDLGQCGPEGCQPGCQECAAGHCKRHVGRYGGLAKHHLSPEEKAALAASDYGATGPAGPPTGAVAYPYYTTRGPRDFLAKKPPSIGP
jgi:hypothetical protein